MSQTDAQTPRRLNSLPTPPFTTLRHAIRWIGTGHRFLDIHDQLAINDLPDINSADFDEAKSELLLAVRNGLVHTKGSLSVWDKRCRWFRDKAFWGNPEWDAYMKQYAKHLLNSEQGFLESDDIPIPPKTWNKDEVHWNSETLLCLEGGQIQARFLYVEINSRDLLAAFGNPQDQDIRPQYLRSNEQALHTKEKESLLKLVIGMAVEQYAYNPKAARSDTVKNIASDLAHLGISLDIGTIRKFLRKGTDLLPPEALDDDKP